MLFPGFNERILEAFQELSELYFKEGNKNAGMSYAKKATSAIKDLELEITEENVKSLGKPGKNKVDGIGAKSVIELAKLVVLTNFSPREERLRLCHRSFEWIILCTRCFPTGKGSVDAFIILLSAIVHRKRECSLFYRGIDRTDLHCRK
jgi:hypothetical protein